MPNRQINQAGLDLIRNAEGCVLHPYKDGAGKPTIGIGHLILPHEHFGKISEQQADELLQNDLRQAERSFPLMTTSSRLWSRSRLTLALRTCAARLCSETSMRATIAARPISSNDGSLPEEPSSKAWSSGARPNATSFSHS